MQDRAQIGAAGAAAQTAADGGLRDVHSFLIAGIVVGGAGIARLFARPNEHIELFGPRWHPRHPERAVAAPRVIAAFGEAFGSLEIGQQIAPAPAPQPPRRPAVEIARIAPVEQHRID